MHELGVLHDRTPATTVCRAATGPAAQPRLDRIGRARRRTRRPSSGQHTRSPTAPGASSARARPRGRGTPPSRGSRSRARRGPPHRLRPRAQLRPSSIALRASIHSDARVGRRRAVAAEADRRRPRRGARAPARCRRRRSSCSSSGSARRPMPARAEPARPRRRSGRCSARPTLRSLHPADVLEVLDRAAAEGLLARTCPRRGPRRGGCAAARRAARRARPCARMSSGVTENGEHGASAMRTIAPHDRSWCSADQPLAVGEDLVVVLHDRVGREAAVLLRQAHRPARRVEAHARVLAAARISAVMRSPPPRGCT